jgi:hypothetical protein
LIILKSKEVRLKVLSPTLAYIFYKLSEFHEKKLGPQPNDLVITSINDSVHMPGSKHYTNEAIDIRSQSFNSDTNKIEFALTLQDFLGPKFKVLLENLNQVNEHFHVQVRRDTKFP